MIGYIGSSKKDKVLLITFHKKKGFLLIKNYKNIESKIYSNYLLIMSLE